MRTQERDSSFESRLLNVLDDAIKPLVPIVKELSNIDLRKVKHDSPEMKKYWELRGRLEQEAEKIAEQLEDTLRKKLAHRVEEIEAGSAPFIAGLLNGRARVPFRTSKDFKSVRTLPLLADELAKRLGYSWFDPEFKALVHVLEKMDDDALPYVALLAYDGRRAVVVSEGNVEFDEVVIDPGPERVEWARRWARVVREALDAALDAYGAGDPVARRLEDCYLGHVDDVDACFRLAVEVLGKLGKR